MSIYISGNNGGQSLDSLVDVTGFSNAVVGKTYGLRKDKIGLSYKPVETSNQVSQINLGNGLVYNSQNQLGVVLEEPSGLQLNDNGLSIETGTLSSLEKTSSGLGVKTDLNGPLENGANGLTARQITNGGLSITNGLAVNIKTGGGLDIVNNELGIKIKPDAGVNLTNDGIGIRIKNGGGLILDSNGLSSTGIGIATNVIPFEDELFIEEYDATAFSKAREELILRTTPNPLAPPNLFTRTAGYTPTEVFRFCGMSDKYIDYIVSLGASIQIFFTIDDRRNNVNRAYTTAPLDFTDLEITVATLNGASYNFTIKYSSAENLFYFTDDYGNGYGKVTHVYLKLVISDPLPSHQLLRTTESNLSKLNPRTKFPLLEVKPDLFLYRSVNANPLLPILTRTSIDSGDLAYHESLPKYNFISFLIEDNFYTQRYPLNCYRPFNFTINGKNYIYEENESEGVIGLRVLTGTDDINVTKFIFHKF